MAIKKNKPVLKENIKKKREFRVALTAIALIVIFIVSYIAFHNLKTIEYKDLIFTKEKFGDIPVYRYTYYFEGRDKNIITHNFYVRTNPEKNSIPVEGDLIEFPPKSKFVYISINGTDLTECPTSRIALASLAQFLNNNQFTVKTGVPDREESESQNLPLTYCGMSDGNAVISIASAERSRVFIDGLCYRIEVANCEVIEAVEKFEVESLVTGKIRASN